MITAAVASMQARKLNYVEVEIVPKPSTGKKPFIHITDVSVQYSTIIFPERDGKGTPHNSIVADDPLQVPCGIQEFEEGAQDVPPNLPMRDDQRSECKKHSGTATPPRRRRSHSSPQAPRGKKISSSERCEQIEECNSNENYKTRTLPSAEAPWHDDVFMVETPKNEETQEKMATERVERGKQDTPTRKMKKFFRTGRHVSDLGATQDILQAVQAMQKKVRRKSSGESGDSSSDLGYSSNSHEVGSVGASGSVPSHQETVPTSLRNPPPIPGSMRNTELEKAMTRRKLSKQNSIDQKKMKVEKKDVCSPVVSETKQRTKFLQIFPTMKFGKFGGSSSKSKEAKQEAKNQQIKKPVPLPRYNKNLPSPSNSCSESLDSTDLIPETILCESRVQEEDSRGSEVEAETYVNVVFQQRQDGHNYENVNLEEKSSSDHNLQHFTTAESYHHSRPLPAPRLNTPHLPIKDHKATPPDQKEDILSPSPKKRDLDSPRQTGYETVSYKPPCLQLYNEGFFPKHVGSSFEEDETTGSINEEYQSSCDEEATTRKREIELLSLALKQDLSLSKEKRIKCDPPPKRNSDGSVRSVPEGWGSGEYAVFKQPEKEEHRSFHHKHIRSHSSGGQLVLFNSNITVLHTGENVNQKGGDKGEIRSADMFPIVKMDTFKPTTQNSPPHHHGREPKRVPRTTHEHVTLGQHVHSSLHSSPLGESPKEKELKYKYLDDVPSLQRGPQAGSPSRQGQTPDVPCLQRSPQAGSRSTQGQNPDGPCLQRSPQAGSPSTQGPNPWWDDNGEEDQLEEKPIPSYINQPWYYGKLLRQECDYLMISKGNPCQYLVRDSSHRAGGLMLCVLYGQKVHHYIIHVINNIEYQMAGHTFASVSEIIEFYRKHVIMYSPNQEPVFLGEPFLYPR